VFVSFVDETCEQHRISNCMGHLNQTKTNEGKTILQSGVTGSHSPIIVSYHKRTEFPGTLLQNAQDLHKQHLFHHKCSNKYGCYSNNNSAMLCHNRACWSLKKI